MRTCVLFFDRLSLPVFLLLVLFLFQLYLMSNWAPDEFSMEKSYVRPHLGRMVTLDYVTPLTDCESKDMELTGRR